MVQESTLMECGVVPEHVQSWKHKVGFHNRGVQWDTPMARCAGEGRDWIELMTRTRPRKEDVIWEPA